MHIQVVINNLDSTVTLQAIRQIIAQEVGHLEIGLKKNQDDMGKAFDSLEHGVYSKLSDIAQKIDVLEVEHCQMNNL